MDELLKMDSFLNSLSIARIDENPYGGQNRIDVFLNRNKYIRRAVISINYLNDDSYDLEFIDIHDCSISTGKHFKTNLADLKTFVRKLKESRNCSNEDLREYLCGALESLGEE